LPALNGVSKANSSLTSKVGDVKDSLTRTLNEFSAKGSANTESEF
jgi:hypothetical protein